MNNIPQITQNENDFMKSITSFVKKFKVISALKKSNCYKEKGTSVYDIFCYLLQLVYTGCFLQVSSCLAPIWFLFFPLLIKINFPPSTPSYNPNTFL